MEFIQKWIRREKSEGNHHLDLHDLFKGSPQMSEGEKRKELEGALRPPDGGWGWMVVCGSALSHMFVIPILQNFTLIFKDRFIELGFSSSNITTLVSLNASFGMILGLLNGPLLKIFGYRKMALVGLTLYVVGILCTGTANSYIEFILFYGLLSSVGMAMTMAAFSLAINSYFVKNRSKAIGYTVTLTGLGPITLPFVISYLLSSYGLKWTVFLLSGLSLHSYVGALLLQPVNWHMKSLNENISHEKKENKVLLSDIHSFLEMSISSSRMSLPSHSVDFPMRLKRAYSKEFLQENLQEPMQAKQDRRKPRKLSVTFLDNEDYKNMMNSTLHIIERIEISGKNVNYASAETLDPEIDDYLNDINKSIAEPLNSKLKENQIESGKLEDQVFLENINEGWFFRFKHFLKSIYDLDLLLDPFYISMTLGLSSAFVGEVIFSTMTPIIFREIGFDTEDTASFMSVIAGCDLLFRFIAPFVGKKLNLNSKKMYLIALFILFLSRASMYLASTYETCILVSLVLGIGKGFRSVFWVLVLPDYVSLSKLPSASAFQSLVNGILILISGPLIGAITTLSNSYFSIIVTSNILTLTTILLWCGEIIYLKYKKKG